MVLWLLLCRSICRVTPVKTTTAWAIVILRIVVSRVGCSRVIIRNITWPVWVARVRAAITGVRPVHPWVIAVYPDNVVLLLLRIACCLCQCCRVVVIDGSANITVVMGDATVWISIFISYCIYHGGRARPVITGRTHYSWPVHIDGIVTDHGPVIIAIGNIVHTHWFA